MVMLVIFKLHGSLSPGLDPPYPQLNFCLDFFFFFFFELGIFLTGDFSDIYIYIYMQPGW